MRSSVSIVLFLLLSGLFLAALIGAIERSRKLLGIAGACVAALVCIIVFVKPVQLPSLRELVKGTTTTTTAAARSRDHAPVVTTSAPVSPTTAPAGTSANTATSSPTSTTVAPGTSSINSPSGQQAEVAGVP